MNVFVTKLKRFKKFNRSQLYFAFICHPRVMILILEKNTYEFAVEKFCALATCPCYYGQE